MRCWTPSLVTATGMNTENVREKEKEDALRKLCGGLSIIPNDEESVVSTVVRSSGMLTNVGSESGQQAMSKRSTAIRAWEPLTI